MQLELYTFFLNSILTKKNIHSHPKKYLLSKNSRPEKIRFFKIEKHEYKNGKQEYKEEESGKEQKIEVDEEQVKPTKQALEEGGLEEEAGEEP